MKAKKMMLLLLCGGSVISTTVKAQEKAPMIRIDGIEFADLNRNGKLDAYEDTRLSMDKRVEDLLSKLSLEEKANMVIGTGMGGFEGVEDLLGGDIGSVQPDIEGVNDIVPGAAGTTTPIKRLGIPPVILADGPAGLRINATRPNDTKTYYCTAFPTGISLSSTWDKQLIKQVGESIGKEVLEYGTDVLLGPAMNIQRDPLCGRNYEYYSEDPVLSGHIGAAIVNGIQSNNVGASVKHFAVNNIESNRMSINEHVSQRALREIYLRNFEIAIKESQPWTIMTSYNKVNGKYTSADRDLLTEILRNDWGYKGMVMSDWFGGYPAMTGLKTFESHTIRQMKAGNDLLMPGITLQRDEIIAAVKDGSLDISILNTNVKRILSMILSSPVMNNYKFSNSPDLKAHAKVSLQAGAEGMVLLKNQNNALPLGGTHKNVSMFGVYSYSLIAGGTGSGEVNNLHTVSFVEGLAQTNLKINPKLEKIYKPHVQKELDKYKNRKGLDIIFVMPKISELELKKDVINNAAKEDDIAIITIGRLVGENNDRAIEDDYNLTVKEQELIDNVSKAFHAQNKKVVVILNIGSVVETASWKDKVDAILLSWMPGQEGGYATTDVVMGKINPSGKLPVTFPIRYEDGSSAKNFPSLQTNPTEVTYEEGIYVGYRYFSSFGVKPSFEFGYGLSYTTFDYSNLKISDKQFENKLFVSVDVKNTGSKAGKEVVQLYLSAPNDKIDRPSIELKGFAKTRLLEPGETQTISMEISPKDLAYFSEKEAAWVAEKGNYIVKIGASSLDIRQQATFNLDKTQIVEKVSKNAMLCDTTFKDLTRK